MTFKAAKCPNCAGDLQLPEDRDTVKCMYCGSDIIVREAIKLAGGVNIENLLMLAKNLEDKNTEEAYKYYSTVLEYDTNNVDAWVGKGFTGYKIDKGLDLTKECFKNALDITPDKEKLKSILIDRVEKEIFSGSFMNHPAFDKFKAIEFIDPDTDNPDVLAYRDCLEAQRLLGVFPEDRFLESEVLGWVESANVEGAINYFKMSQSKSNHPEIMKYITSTIKEAVLQNFVDNFMFDSEEAHKSKPVWDGDSRNYRIPFPVIRGENFDENNFDGLLLIKKIKMLYDYFLTFNEPLSGYTDRSGEIVYEFRSLKVLPKVILGIQKYWILMINEEPDYRKDTRYIKFREYLIEKIRESEPGYKPPKPQKDFAVLFIEDHCFIATAAWGSPMAHEVILLREYRDNYLRDAFLGKGFIKAYYLFSPPIASVISKSEFLRAITRQLLKPIILVIEKYYGGDL